MHDEHQTSPGTAEPLQGVTSPTSVSQGPSLPLTQLDIELRVAKLVPLPDPFQFTVYLALLASTGSSQ